MNTFLLLKVKQAILDNPEAFRMHTWDCNTAACIAGWAARIGGGEQLSVPRINFSGKLEATRSLLKLDGEQWKRLVYKDNWPDQFDIVSACGDPKKRAEIAAARVDHFISTNGSE